MNTNPVMLITGAASGIGCVIAEGFLATDYQVFVCDAEQAHVTEFARAHPQARTILADVSNPEQVEKLFTTLTSEVDRLDVLINNAGIAGPTALVEDISPEDWERTIAVDLNGQFFVTRLAVPLLKRTGGGSIINIASNAAFTGCPMRSPYTASKWAMIGFTKTLAMELGPFGIRVNAICPGSVEGERINAVIARDAGERGCDEAEIRDIYQRQSSLRTFVTADDVANFAMFLASVQGARISGQAMGVDGHTESLANRLD